MPSNKVSPLDPLPDYTLLTKCTGVELTGLRCAVTGGCGFLGAHLVKLCIDAGAAHVRVLDASPKSKLLSMLTPNGVDLCKCDIRNPDEVNKAIEQIDVVFHTASYFGFPLFSSNGMGDHQKMVDINVGGTQNLLNSAIRNRTKIFVYISSSNAVFSGLFPIVNGKEDMPYPEFVDSYGTTKSEAEKLVISHNNSGGLVTCSLRPNGIYGPWEINNVARGLRALEPYGGMYFAIGSLKEGKKALSDWTFVENIAYSAVLAAKHLNAGNDSVAGEIFNITDGVAINNVEFLKPIIEGVGFGYNPWMKIPAGVMVGMASMMEKISFKLRPRINFVPILTPLEVRKVTVTHYFNIEKAKRVLGYEPLDVDRCREVTIDFFKKHVTFDLPIPKPPWFMFLGVIIPLVFLAFAALHPPEWFGGDLILGLRYFVYYITFTLTNVNTMPLPDFQRLILLRCLFLPGITVHAVDAIIGMILQRKEKAGRIIRVGIQTVLLGYPSLRYYLPKDVTLAHALVGLNSLLIFIVFILSHRYD